MRVYVSVCIYPHNYDRGRHVCFDLRFYSGAVCVLTNKKYIENICPIVSFWTPNSIVRGVIIGAPLYIAREPRGSPYSMP